MVNAIKKGKTGERELLTKLSELLNLDEKLTRNLDQTRCGGADCVQLPGVAIEIKNQNTLNVTGWWKQAVQQAKALNRLPVLAYKVPRKGWLVVVPFSWIYYNVRFTTSDLVYPDVVDTVQMSLENFAKLYQWNQDHNYG